MATVLALVTYLRDNGVEFRVTAHLPAYSTQALAAANHMPVDEAVHVEVCKADAQYWMAVLPGNAILDQRKLRGILRVHAVSPVDKWDLERLFPACEPAAVPPFGSLFGIGVIVDTSVARAGRMVFHACSHTESIVMDWPAFMRLVGPLVAPIADRSHAPSGRTKSGSGGRRDTRPVQFQCRGCASIFWVALPRDEDGRTIPLTCSSCGMSDPELMGPLVQDSTREEEEDERKVSVS